MIVEHCLRHDLLTSQNTISKIDMKKIGGERGQHKCQTTQHSTENECGPAAETVSHYTDHWSCNHENNILTYYIAQVLKRFINQGSSYHSAPRKSKGVSCIIPSQAGYSIIVYRILSYHIVMLGSLAKDHWLGFSYMYILSQM